jgi:hypothetical protein
MARATSGTVKKPCVKYGDKQVTAPLSELRVWA